MNVIQKNLLDLRFNQHLQALHTTILLILTYILGLVVSIITRQITHLNRREWAIVFSISAGLLFFGVYFIFHFNRKLKKVQDDIKGLAE